MQRRTSQITAKDMITNFRRLLIGKNNVDVEPPHNPPQDWRVMCNSILPAGKEASNRRKLKTVRSVILQQLVMNNWEDAVDTFGIKVSCEALMPFTRFDDIEKVPALLYEFILKLQDEQEAGQEEDSADVLTWEAEGTKISMLVGTALDPPKVKAEVIVAECVNSDESFSKDEIRVIIQKFQSRQLQRQVFAIFTSFEQLGGLFGLAKELNLEADAVLLKETTIRSHKVTDKELPATCEPVMLLTKMSSAIQQKFHLPIPEQKLVTNFFDNLHDLMNVIKFPQDLVVDTTLDVNVAKAVKNGTMAVIASERDLQLYKERLSGIHEE
ncbi:uncharacterized protein [Porites lutea]|uniref:uncharacterized protein isoform X1 n=1 Tax=Porites lutea TaxID=51062 RepID=UPI003CC68E6D